jgi:hypothetical protein
MFVAAPFVEVENAHIRQLNAEQDPGFLAGDRMAFAMRQLRVDTLSDICRRPAGHTHVIALQLQAVLGRLRLPGRVSPGESQRGGFGSLQYVSRRVNCKQSHQSEGSRVVPGHRPLEGAGPGRLHFTLARICRRAQAPGGSRRQPGTALGRSPPDFAELGRGDRLSAFRYPAHRLERVELPGRHDLSGQDAAPDHV